MRKVKVTIKSFIDVINDCIESEGNEIVKEFDHDIDCATANQIMYEDIISQILNILDIDWDIEEVK